MSQNRLVFPHGVTIVFCDRGASQKLQADFYSTRRSEEFGYGVYYHIGFWSSGPHLLQGSLPSRIHDEFSRVVAKGDTDIAIINVCNIREHVLGIQAATEMMTDFTNWDEPAFWDRFAPPCLHGLYRSLLQCFFPLSEDRIMQDGALFAAARKMVANYASGHRKNGVLNEPVLTARKAQLRRAIATLDRLVAAYPDQRQQLTLRQGPFYDVHLLTQARLWRELFAFYLALIEAEREPARVEDAQSALQHFLEIRQAATRGKWAGWYRGDKKVNVPELLAATANARTRLLEKTSGGR